MRLIWSPEAVADLAAIHDYIGQHNPMAALRVAGAIRDAANNLQRFANLGHGGAGQSREWLVPVTRAIF